MRDHEYPMSDARERALDAIDPTTEMLRDEYGEDADLDDAWRNHEESSILSIDVEHVVDVMLTVGGPTCFFRVWCDEDYDVKRIEYHDSWASPVTVVQLTDDEEARVLATIGPHLDGIRDAAR